MELKPLDCVMVDAIVAEACDHYVALTMDEVFGNTHLIVRPDTIHAPIASTREKIVKEIRAVEMSQSARGAVEAIINKHLDVRR
jgi:hypothetical protein